MLLYLAFRRVGEALLIISSVPFALVGGIWLLWWIGLSSFCGDGYGLSCPCRGRRRIWRGDADVFSHAIEAEPSFNDPQTFSEQKLDEALYHGAVLRVHPKAMTVAVIIAGLLPILWGTGAGSEVISGLPHR
ncbi:hypothetical protein ACULNC_08495 [Shigella flexneri]